jgi:lipopolysaccharide transport system permease protein
LHTLYYLNPMTPVVQGFRWSFLNDAVAPPLWSIGFSLLVSTVILFIGLIIFHRTERDVVDYI